MQVQPITEGWRGVMVSTGLGSPTSRAFTAAVLAGVAAYAAKYPRESFRADGSMRPHSALSLSGDATSTHFLLTPLAVGTAVFLFT